jgi:hypothetical protein
VDSYAIVAHWSKARVLDTLHKITHEINQVGYHEPEHHLIAKLIRIIGGVYHEKIA